MEEHAANTKLEVQLSPVSIRSIDKLYYDDVHRTGAFQLEMGGKMRTEGSGFSLIEILIVMGVLSILAIVFTV